MKILFYLAILLPVFSFTQTIEPSKSTENNYLQIETEVFLSEDKAGSVTTKSWNLFNILMRYGLTNSIEFNIALSNAKEKEIINNQLTYSQHKFDNLKIGILKNIELGKRFSQEMAIQFDVLVPLDKHHENATKVGAIIGLNFTNELSNSWLLSYNLGYLKDVDASDNYFYRLNTQFLLNDNWVLFTENAGKYYQSFAWEQSVGFGFYKNDWALEMALGKGFNSPDYFVGGKIICSLNVKKKTIN